MAINIKFDLSGNPEPPTIILANRNGNKLGQLDVNVNSIELKDRFNDASEFSFTLNKYKNGVLTNLWDKVVDFKLVYCKEWDEWFEIKVELDEDTETIKTVFCTQLGQAELSQIMLYDIEINTEADIARDDYKITILYDLDDQEASLLNRLLKDKAPHYTVEYVSPTISKIQRTFSFDGISIYDALQEVAEEIGCLFEFRVGLDDDGVLQRKIAVYDLQQYCEDCGYRGEYTDKCPKCNSDNITNGYGDDTLIFVTSDELASGGIQLVTDTDSVKNCFKLEAGDDLMTAAIRTCNPNGTDYIWYFSDSIKEDMTDELVNKLESYDTLYKECCNEKIFNLDENLVEKYNALVEKYKEYYNTDSSCIDCGHKGEFEEICPECDSKNIIVGDTLQTITNPVIGYSSLMNTYYNAIDLDLYLESSLMPNVKIGETNAEEQLKLLTTPSLSPVAVNVQNIDSISLATANSAVLSMAKVIVKSTYKVEIKTSSLSDDKIWRGQFVITNYSDENDTATNESTILVIINNDTEAFIKQKLEKSLNKDDADNLSISGLFEREYDDFCAELKKYALNPLKSFYEACESCLDILVDQGAGNKDENPDLYSDLYEPYYNKSLAIASEIKVREDEIAIIQGTYDKFEDGDKALIVKGLQANIEEHRNDVQIVLDFKEYLGKDLWLEFCSYRREDKYSNENYISDGLNNAELFKKALEFFEAAENEIFKSAELQHSISTSLNNLLAIPKFKSLVQSFKTGNWIRVQVNDEIYKLRLLEYDIKYSDFNNIPVEFSDISKIKNGITDVQDIFSQASSMATSYSYVQKQANQGNNAKTTIEQWISEGLNSANVQIQSNDREEAVLSKNGYLFRSYDDITNTYSPEQFRITHNIMAYTNDEWRTVRQAIGKHDYIIYEKVYDKDGNIVYDEYGNISVNKVNKTGYGMSADFVTAGVVSGSQIIGGDIYSNNYSVANNTGSYINLTNGTFSLGGGSLRYDGTGSELIISSTNIPTKEEVTKITAEYLETTNVFAKKMEVDLANVKGELIVGDGNKVLLSANVEEDLVTIGGFNVNEKSIYSKKIAYNDYNEGVYIGIDGIGLGKGTFYVNPEGELYAEGKIVAVEGKIGDFRIDGRSISSNVYDNDGNPIIDDEELITKRVLVSTGMGSEEYTVTVGDDIIANNWSFLAGTSFGVKNTGEMYAANGRIGGCTFSVPVEIVMGSGNRDYDLEILPDEEEDGFAHCPREYRASSNYGYQYILKINTKSHRYGQLGTRYITYSGHWINGDNSLFIENSYIPAADATLPCHRYMDKVVYQYGASVDSKNWANTDWFAPSVFNVDVLSTNPHLWVKASFFKNIEKEVANPDYDPDYDPTEDPDYDPNDPSTWGDNSPTITEITCEYIADLYYYVGNFGTFSSIFQFGEDGILFSKNTLSNQKTSITLGSATGSLVGTWYLNSSSIMSSWRGAKHDIESIDDRYSVLFDNLSPVRYKYNDGTSNRYHTGFILDELKTAMDKAEIDDSELAAYCVSDEVTGEGGIRYDELVALCVDQIQKLKIRAAEQDQKIIDLESKISN